jgi:8-oxo-dGTP pyrophosphatase MutT (NUDIX family)
VTAGALDLATVRDRVARYEPDARPEHTLRGWQAATALVVSPGEDDGELAVAFILRTERQGDRWSGQMALPGGKRDVEDDDLAATAVRETREEVGLALPAPVGRLDDQGGRVHRGIVATYVFVLERRQPMTPHPGEVAEALWIPLPSLFDPGSAARFRWGGIPFPALEHEGRIIWGLTHRILGSFAEAIGLELPRP